MIPVVIGRPYQFVPPYAGTNWLRVIKPIVPWFLRRSWGVETIDFRGGERLAESLRAGHGVLIAANHARPCDPFVIGLLPLRLGKPCHYLAAWHIFTNDSRFHAWLLRRVGAFSIHRWGLDRESLKASIQILADARRPLMLFPEGLITRANDRLGPVLDGTAFIARSAARQRAKQSPAGKIVVHPAAIHYCFDGDICDAVDRVLSPI
jgi:1-acyl-sn-glycerol-3-phosphate acyltransferase